MIIRTIAEVLTGRLLSTVAPECDLRRASLALKEAEAGALAVMEKDHLVGILCERDVLRRVICEGRRADDTRVREVMTRNPRTISAGQSLAAAMAEMIDGGFRHLPVTRDGRVVGMLSMRDIPTQYRLMFERFAEVRPATSGVERSIRATI